MSFNLLMRGDVYSSVPASPKQILSFIRPFFLLFCLLSGFSLLNHANAPVTGVTAELLLNEGTGTNTIDASGNAHNGTLTNGAAWIAGKYGQGINFDGANDYLNIADHANFTLDPTISYTWSSWVKPTNMAAWGTVWSQTVDANNYFYYYVHTTNDAEAGPVTNGITVYWMTNGGSNRLVLHSNNNVLTAGQWAHVAITYNAGAAQSSRFTIYVNGVDVTNRTDVVNGGTLSTINPTNIRAGGNQPWGDYFNGALDEMRYYRRLLTVAEIQQDMNTGNQPDTEAPAVSISSPGSGSSVDGTTIINATATDNTGVAGVQFQLDGVNLGAEDIVAPYSYSWNTSSVSNGPHTLMAIARDAAGNTTTSSAINVTVNNFVDTEPPVVSVSSPANGATVLNTINVSATATDNVAVTGVQFQLDGVNLGAEDVAPPYAISWNSTTVSNGNHSLTAIAKDVQGNTATSTAVVVTVNNFVDTEGPAVSISSPASGSTVASTVNINATSSDNVAVVGVQFILDGVNLGAEDLSTPYSASWNTTGSTNGTHTLTARARDAAGNSTLSAPVTVTVFNNNLVAAYGFNENSGTVLNDNSGNGNNGTLSGPTWTASGKNGAALSFDGTNDLVNINDANSLDLTNGMTIEAWVRPNTLTGYRTILCKEQGTNNLVYALSANNSTSGAANQRPTSRIRTGSTTRTLTGTSKLPLAAWSHIASTYDGANFRFYVNGIQVATLAATGNMNATTNVLRLGGSTTLGGQYFNGLIDEVRIYNRALSAAEIQTDMNTPVAPDLTNPIVNITSPAPNATVNGSLTIAATATDDISVVGVQFLLDGAAIGAEDLVAPYTVTLNTLTFSNGAHNLTAIARDAAGNTSSSSVVPIIISNDTEAPTVSVVSPATGSTVAGNVELQAEAADNVGIAGVQFLLNGVNLGMEDVTAPYSLSWNSSTVANGAHLITARARDAAGNTLTSVPVTVNVLNTIPDTESPVVSISSPAPGDVSGSISITSSATDNIGVVGVQFQLNGVNLSAEDLTAPYEINWNTFSVSNGAYILTAIARDAAGNTTTSSTVSINVNNLADTENPAVTITSPSAGNVSGTVAINATATDNTGVVGVQFQLDGVNIGAEDLAAPYTFSWNTLTVSNGAHLLTAIARDAAGNIQTSASVSITVDNDTEGPAVSITTPAAGTVSATVNVTASATDNTGVMGVQFLLDGVALGTEDLSSPYSISWNTAGVGNGIHTLTARARDAAGNTTTSSSVSVTVTNNTNLISAMHFNEGSGTSVADISGNAHNGTLSNGPTWVTGKYGQSVNFDGSNDYLSIADHANFTLDPTQSYTWSAWIKNNNFNAWGTVWGQTIDANNYFYFYSHSTNDAEAGPVTNGITLYWLTNGGTNKVVLHSNNNVLTTGQWSYVTLTYNATLAQASRFTIYVNGADVTNRTDVLSSGTLASINPTNIRMGANQPWGDYLNGAVDEFRFYKKLLTVQDIISDMNTPIGVDNILPTVSISSPLSGATVGGTVNINASASDNVGVSGVQFQLDGINLGSEDLVAPYAVSWNTSTTSNGLHVLTAIARDAAGNLSTSAQVNVTVGPDFSLVVTNPSQSVGTSGTVSGFDVSFLNGFSSNAVSLSVTGLTTGITAAFDTNPMTGAGQNGLTITTNNASAGTYPLSISATAEGLTRTQQISLVINGVADFALSSSPVAQNVLAGNATTYIISLSETGDFVNPVTLTVLGLPTGITASFNPATRIPSGTSTLTLTTTTAAQNGTYNFTVQGVSGSLTRTTAITLTVSNVPPSSLSLPTGFSVINVGGSVWDQPMGTVFTSDGDKMFVWEKRGVVYVATRNAQQLYDRQETQVLNIATEVGNWADHGLMSVALDPNFSSTTGGYIYLLYVVDRRFLLSDNSIPADQGFDATIGRITRYKVVNSGGTLIIDTSPAERRVLLGEAPGTGIPILHDSHGLGSLVFAADGTLLASTGDGANYLTTDVGSDPQSYYVKALNGIIRTAENVGSFRSQLLNSHSGKILRIDPVTGDGIPSNPFYAAAEPRAPKSRVWALGLRNPFRMNIKPGSGSTNPAAGDVGDIYVGDVGWNNWEELNIIKDPGTNCGWPLFEGLTTETNYSASNKINDDEPNPLAGGGCPAKFQFRQLLKQATADGSTTLTNPCTPFSVIPGTTSNNRFVHRRPSLEWRHGQNVARVGIFSGNTADVAAIGTAASGVVGSQFQGNCSVGGFWYTGTLFPTQYRDSYFHADYGGQWLKNLKVDFTDVIQEVQNFASGFGAIISMTENPADGTIYCVDLGDNTIKRISFGGNQFPVVKMTADKTFGPSVLNVNFTGNNSFDPEGSELTYLWSFGDNTTSTEANPVHSFTGAANTPTKYVVKLTVRDNLNATASDSIIISVNNTPPVVNITSPVNNSAYRIGLDTSYTCTAIVSDAEHSQGQLKYKWQTFLRHNNHEHPAPIDTTRNTSSFLARVGCNGDVYYYFFKLTVTDAAGLSTIDSVKIFPECLGSRSSITGKEAVVSVNDELSLNNAANKKPGNGGQLVISPNPVLTNFTVRYETISEGPVTVRILDVNGRLLSRSVKAVGIGQNLIYLQKPDGVKAGTYLVTVRQGDIELTEKVIFQSADDN